MELERINKTIDKWLEMTDTVLDLEKFSLAKMQDLLEETYKILIVYHKEALVPKEISKLLLEMDSLLYFTSLMEDKEVGIDFYHCQHISAIVEALKEGFFDGEYKSAFPNLRIFDVDNNEITIDFETNIFLNNYTNFQLQKGE